MRQSPPRACRREFELAGRDQRRSVVKSMKAACSYPSSLKDWHRRRTVIADCVEKERRDRSSRGSGKHSSTKGIVGRRVLGERHDNHDSGRIRNLTAFRWRPACGGRASGRWPARALMSLPEGDEARLRPASRSLALSRRMGVIGDDRRFAHEPCREVIWQCVAHCTASTCAPETAHWTEGSQNCTTASCCGSCHCWIEVVRPARPLHREQVEAHAADAPAGLRALMAEPVSEGA